MKKIIPGLIIGGVSAIVIFLTQIVFANPGEDSMWLMLAAYLLVFFSLFAAGFWYKTTGEKGGGIRIGSITGALLLLIVMATYALIDNVFLATVSRQTEKIWAFKHSHYPSMRAYLNWSLLKGFLLGLPLFVFFGAVFGGMGGVTATYFFRKRNRKFPPLLIFIGRFLPFAAAISLIAMLLLLSGLVALGYQFFTGWALALATAYFIFIIVELLRRSEKR